MAKVFLSAGHGGSDPGAVGNGLKEKDINLQTLLSCKSELERHGVTVICSRTKDEDDPVGQEVKEANKSKADIAVSFHANAGGGDGFEAFYYPTSTSGKVLAELGEKHVKALGQNSRGVKTGNHLYFVRRTSMPSVLFESFFVDNSNDAKIGDTIAEQQAFGMAYAKAILEYFGIVYREQTYTKTESCGNTKTIKIEPAKKFNKKYAKSYKVKVKIGSTLNLRTGASVTSPVITKIKRNQKVRCYGYYTKNGNTTWLLVSYNGLTGYCSLGYLK